MTTPSFSQQDTNSGSATPQPAGDEQLTPQQQADLNDPQTQARYEAEFNAQLRRRFCPGCGDN